MKNRYLISCMLVILLVTHLRIEAQFQKKIDSLLVVLPKAFEDTVKVKIYEAISKNYAKTRSQTEIARIYADSMRWLSDKLAYKDGKMSAYYCYGMINQHEGNYTIALEQLDRFIAHCKVKGDVLSEARARYRVGNVHLELGNYDLSMHEFEKILKIYEAREEWPWVVGTLNSIGGVYGRSGKYHEAIATYYKAIAVNDSLKLDMPLIYIRLNIGMAHTDLGEYDQALEAYRYSLKMSYRYNNKHAIAANMRNIGNVCYLMNRPDEALSYNLRALHLREKLPQRRDLAFSFIEVGNNYLGLKKYVLAEEYLKKGLALSKELKAKPIMRDAYNYLAQLHVSTGDYQKAYQFKEVYHLVNDSIFSEAKVKQINELQTKYEASQKDKKIGLLAKEKEVQVKEIQRQHTIKKAFIGGFILMTLFAGLLFYIFRQRVRNQKTLAAKNEALEKSYNAIKEQNLKIQEQHEKIELLLKEIHHRVKNNLQTISSLISLQTAEIDNPKALDAMLESKSRVHSMALIHQKLYQGANLATIEMKDYLDSLGNHLRDTYGRNAEEVRIRCTMEKIELDVDIAIPIGLMVNELVTNSLKYAFPNGHSGGIDISLKREIRGLLHLTVSDNGVGKLKKGQHNSENGFGSRLIQLLARQLNGSLIQRSVGGTSVEIQFQYKEAA